MASNDDEMRYQKEIKVGLCRCLVLVTCFI